MPTLTPGVYIEEIPSGVRAIAPAATAVTALFGVTDGDEEPALVTSAAAFADRWPTETPLGRAVTLFFAGGGACAWVAPLAALTADAVSDASRALPADVSLACVPADPVASPAVIAALESAVADRRVMLLLEGPWDDPAAATSAMAAGTSTALGAHGPDAAVYWPRLRAHDGSTVSPLGAVAGVIARTDARRGVWKAPAGREAVLRGIHGPAVGASVAEYGELNRRGVNALRSLTGLGPVVWGARTVSTDPEWRYVSVRRTALFLQESITRGLRWAVFEPNDEPLWKAVRQIVSAFLHGLFGEGAFAGNAPDEAFFVRCDRSTMTQADVQAGRLVVTVGFAAVRPAEFLVLRMTAAAAAP